MKGSSACLDNAGTGKQKEGRKINQIVFAFTCSQEQHSGPAFDSHSADFCVSLECSVLPLLEE